MNDTILFFKGVLWLSLIPILVVIVVFLFLYLLPLFGIFLLDPITVFVIILYPLIIHIGLLYQKVPYSDLDVLDKVTISQAPKEIRNMLVTRTRGTNRLINVEIISSLRKKSLIQSEIAKKVQKRGIILSPTQINKYLSELENVDIIRSQKGVYKREYSLTEKGRWCNNAIKKCFPRRQFWFIVRHYLGYRTLPPFPKKTKE